MEKLNTSADASGTSWLSDLLLEEMGDCDLFQQCNQELLGDDEEFLSHDIDIAGVLQQSLSSESYSNNCYNPSQTLKNSSSPTKKLKTKPILQEFSPSSSSSPCSSNSPPTSQILSFENNTIHGVVCTTTTTTTLINPKQNKVGAVTSSSQYRNMTQTRKGGSPNNNKDQSFETATTPQGTKRSHAHAHDHIIAERKRREKLSQSLIALAALIPDLKKMDKASVLGDAIKYVKELQERLRVLEERNKNTSTAVESVVTVNKSQLSCDDDHSSSSCDEGSEAVSGNNDQRLPHVEARVLGKEVLLRIHCQMQHGLLLKILMEIQNLHLFPVNSSVLPFGDSILDITIVAQMGNSYELSKNDLVKKLRVAAK